MEAEALPVILRKRAEDTILGVYLYICGKGYPETAHRYVQRMYLFADSLGEFPKKAPICRYPQFAKHDLRCAVFDGNYVFVFSVMTDRVLVRNVVHVKRLR
jgi:plasmid stabilization system protein ParE